MLVLVVRCCILAWHSRSPVVPRAGGTAVQGKAWTFALLLTAAFVVYLVGLLLLRRASARLAVVGVIAAAIQFAPLGAPLLLSTDAWTYWGYGRIAAVHGGNPYIDHPNSYPGDPALGKMGARWRDKTSVYGPAFTLASEGVAHAAGSSAGAAAWAYKVIAALAALASAGLAASLAHRRALAAAFVGWNPVLAVHMAGGGHNDAWLGLLVLGAITLAALRRPTLAGISWSLAVAVKWVPLVFLGLQLLEARARRRRLGLAGVIAAAAALSALASWRYGWRWLAALAPLADNARLETSYAIPHRLQSVGVPRDVTLAVAVAILAVGLAWLAWRAARGRARIALSACLLLVTTPYLAVWYLGWAVPLAAADEDDRLARFVVLGLCAYLLPQTIPL